MFGDLLETIGSLGLLASAMIHYRMAFSRRSEALPEDPDMCPDRRQGACVDDPGAAHDRACNH